MKLFTIGNVVNDVTICIGFNIPALKDEAIHMRNLSNIIFSGTTALEAEILVLSATEIDQLVYKLHGLTDQSKA